MTTSKKIWCHSVMLADGWANDVLIHINAKGNVAGIKSGALSNEASTDCQTLKGTLVPGIPNLHSHAHQRAIAGLAEKAGDGSQGSEDSFWTWRKVMYHYLECISPDQLYDIACMVYLEMLKAGYTRVAEFQYLHHDKKGHPFENRAEMTLQCRQAARDVGIGYTALPVLYQYGGFGSEAALPGQNRFLNNAEQFVEIFEQITASQSVTETTGVAPHSLRAVDAGLLHEVLLATPERAVTHLHIAEQVKEVNDCLNWCRQRPVEWLYEKFEPDRNWCLIHATHMTEQETISVAHSGAIAGLCPTTEANLGDGIFNARQFIEAGGRWGIGSDSHISISPVEELRWLEYGQRLASLRRNVLADPPDQLHTGAALFRQSVIGGNAACGVSGFDRSAGIAVGQSADFIVIDDQCPRCYGKSRDSLIDTMVFSGNEQNLAQVWVAGNRIVDQGKHLNETAIVDRFRKTIDALAN